MEQGQIATSAQQKMRNTLSNGKEHENQAIDSDRMLGFRKESSINNININNPTEFYG